MAPLSNHPLQAEGAWEDLLRRSEQFAGRRVRIMVLDDVPAEAVSLRNEALRWLSEADSLLAAPPPATAKPEAFTDGLVEKYRKQGLVF